MVISTAHNSMLYGWAHTTLSASKEWIPTNDMQEGRALTLAIILDLIPVLS